MDQISKKVITQNQILEAIPVIESKVKEKLKSYAIPFLTIEEIVLGKKPNREEHLMLTHVLDVMVGKNVLQIFGPSSDISKCLFARLK